MEKNSAKRWIAFACAIVATTVIIAGLVVGAGVFLDRIEDKTIGSVIDESVVSEVVDDNSKSDITEITHPTEIPEIVKGAPLPEGGFDSMVDLYAQCSKSCVSVISTVEYEYNYGFYGDKVEGTSLGSGFIVEGSKDGKTGYYIITNHHVIEDAKKIEVKFYGSEERHKAKLIGSDEATDIAVLTIEKTDLIPIPMGDSDALQVGQWVVAIGTPMDLELEGTMTYGIISGLNRRLDITNDNGTVIKTMTVIQTSAEINPGNSGGPLINMAGQVIGINAMKSGEDAESLGFALPATKALDIINQIIANGKVTNRENSYVTASAQLGISGATVNNELRDTYSLPDDAPNGVLIITVNRGTAVYEAGLSIYDIITEFDGVKVTSIEQLKELVSKRSAGDKVSMRYYRSGRKFGDVGGYVDCTFVLDGVAG